MNEKLIRTWEVQIKVLKIINYADSFLFSLHNEVIYARHS